MQNNDFVAVTSRSFSKHPELRKELLRRYPNVTFNDKGLKLVGDELIQYLKGHQRAVVGLEKIDGSLLKQLPELKVISKVGVGLDTIDLKALASYNVAFAWMPGTNKRSISELAIAFMILMLRHLPKLNKEILVGEFRQVKGTLLSYKTVGIIGFGAIGQDLANLLIAFNCNILVYDIVYPPEVVVNDKIRKVALEFLLSNSDIVTLHVPLNSSTEGFLTKEKLSLMKRNAILINTARGGLVDEDALYDLLKNNKIDGAAFDVFAAEPPQNLKLLSLPNFFATPHIGGSTEEAIFSMGLAAIDGLDTARVPII